MYSVDKDGAVFGEVSLGTPASLGERFVAYLGLTLHCPPASSATWAIVFQNSAPILGPTIISFEPEKHLPTTKVWNSFHVRDLIAHKNVGVFNRTFTALVDESSVMMITVVAQCNNSQFTKPSGDSMECQMSTTIERCKTLLA
jgi:hypothetical protein